MDFKDYILFDFYKECIETVIGIIIIIIIFFIWLYLDDIKDFFRNIFY